jgi:hypothetical protein
MMRKIVSPESQDLDIEPVAAIPLLSTRKLGEHDRTRLLQRADAELLQKFAHLHIPPGEVPIHIVALGAYEKWAANRNGDAFYRDVCQRYHPTFVKSAKFYRGHNSGPTAPFFGSVKISHYNTRMDRIELVATLFEDSAAAKRAGARGRVADTELQKLAAGQHISTSMGCVVSHDICSGCGNKAKTPKFYCDAGMCKAGGLRQHMGDLLPNGEILHAINPDPDFNDISHVKRGADRISYVMGMLRKSAGDRMISGAELAELVYYPEHQTKLGATIDKMAELEENLEPFAKMAAGCSSLGRRGTFTPPPGIDNSQKLAQALAALADQNIILPAEEFVQLMSGSRDVGRLVKQAAIGIFSRLRAPLVNPFEHWGPLPGSYQLWAARLAPDYSLEKSAVTRRIGIATVRGVPVSLSSNVKQASDNTFAEEVAQHYGLYVMSALARRERNANLGLTAALSLLQNRVG